MGLYSGGLVIGKICASVIWGGGERLFSGGLQIYSFFGGGGGLIIEILRSSWIYENVLSQNISTLTKILPNRALNKSNGPESTQKEREEGKEEGERKKQSILMFLYRRLK